MPRRAIVWAQLIDELIACDDFEDIATLKVIIMTKMVNNFNTTSVIQKDILSL